MGKALKILTVIVFILSIVAFVLGMMNFNKRELLIARTHVLETSIIKLAGTLEAADPVFEGVPDHHEYDVDEVSDMPNDNPAESDFWTNYKDAYEVMGGATMNLNTDDSRVTLRQYYFKAMDESPNKPDYLNGKPQKNALGVFKTEGEGTMKNLLAQVQDRANKQQALLNSTREQLKVVREELETVIDLLNTEKKAHRQSKATITALNKKIADLEVQIDGLNKKIAQLEREKLELNDKISSLESELAQKNEEIASQASEIATLKEEIKRLTQTDAVGAVGDEKAGTSKIILTPGVKGEVVGVNHEYSLVVVKLTDATMKELLGEDLSGEFVPIEVMVIREGYNGTAGNIVTRLRIERISRDGTNLGYADNLYGWEQTPVEIGDKLIY